MQSHKLQSDVLNLIGPSLARLVLGPAHFVLGPPRFVPYILGHISAGSQPKQVISIGAYRICCKMCRTSIYKLLNRKTQLYSKCKLHLFNKSL